MERSLESLLSWWDVSGVDVPDIPKTVPRRLPTKPAADKPKTESRAKQAVASTPSQEAVKLVKKIETLDQLRLAISEFDAAKRLCPRQS